MKAKNSLGLWLLLVAIIGWFAVIRPQLSTFSDNALQVKSKDIESAAYQTRLNHVKAIKDAGVSTQEKLSAYFLAMPMLSQVPETLVMVENLGSSTGIVFNSVSLGSPTGTEVPVNISFTGSLATTSSFLDAVYNNIRTADITSQTVTADKSGNLVFNIQLGFIYQGTGAH